MWFSASYSNSSSSNLAVNCSTQRNLFHFNAHLLRDIFLLSWLFLFGAENSSSWPDSPRTAIKKAWIGLMDKNFGCRMQTTMSILKICMLATVTFNHQWTNASRHVWFELLRTSATVLLGEVLYSDCLIDLYICESTFLNDLLHTSDPR